MASPADPIFGWLWGLIVTSSCVNKGGWVTMTDYLLCRSDPEIFHSTMTKHFANTNCQVDLMQ